MNQLLLRIRRLFVWAPAILAISSTARAQVMIPAPVIGPGLPVARSAPGVALSTLHNFVPVTWAGSLGLVQGSDGNFYGTTSEGGSYGFGAVYQLTPSGSLAILYSFTGAGDGGVPVGALVQGGDGNFYGTTQNGGSSGAGTVFQVTTSGSLTTLYDFTGGGDGASPNALVQGTDGNLYGATAGGGANGGGTIFQITDDGSLTTLYTFSALAGDGTNPDGADPCAGLVQGSDGNFYGTTECGGAGGQGTVFQVSSGGSLTTLYSFAGGNDGGQPAAGVIQGSDGNFYGTTQSGGGSGWGTAFEVSTSGTFNTVYAFTGANDGGYPNGLVQGADGNLYGTTQYGGSASGGTAFQLTTSGSLNTLHAFSGGNDGSSPNALMRGNDGNLYGTASQGGVYDEGTVFELTTGGKLSTLFSGSPASDGANPASALVQGSDGNFYGSTQSGGSADAGVIFQLMAGGGPLTTLYAFTGGGDGGSPNGLIEGGDGNFYGTTAAGGANGDGTIFQLTFGGSLTTLYSFSALGSGGTNSDGGMPCAGLIEGIDGNFYGTTDSGGSNGAGTIFQVSSSGSLSTLYSFTGGNDGGEPFAGVIQGSDGNLYGTTQTGGGNGSGTVFQIAVGGTLNTIYSFTGGNDGGGPNGLVQGNDGNLYGTTQYGGSANCGTAFQVTTSGSLTTLYAFTGGSGGGNPQAGLIQGTDGNFYGTTSSAGGSSNGTAFQLTPGGALTTLYSFGGGNDGADPQAALIQGTDGNFYGTTYGQPYGSGNDNGTVFQLNVAALGTGPGIGPFGIIGPISVGPIAPGTKGVGPIGIIDPIAVGPVGISPVTISGSADPIWVGTPVFVNLGATLSLGGPTTVQPILSTATATNPLGSLTPAPTALISGVSPGTGALVPNPLPAPSSAQVLNALAATAPANATLPLEIGGGTTFAPAEGTSSGSSGRSNTPAAFTLSPALSSTLSPEKSIDFANSSGSISAGVPPQLIGAGPLNGNAGPPSDGLDSTDASQTVSESSVSGTSNPMVSETFAAPAPNTPELPVGPVINIPAHTAGAAAVAVAPATFGASANSNGTAAASMETAGMTGSSTRGLASATPTRGTPGRSGGGGISPIPATFTIAPAQVMSVEPPTPAYSAGVAAGTDAAVSLGAGK